jgi:cell division transport system permease protein
MAKSKHRNNPLTSYLVHHLRVFVSSLGHLSRNAMASMMTSAVIAIALALPAGMYVALDNLGELNSSWDGSTQISLYLHSKVDDQQAKGLADRLRLDPDIDMVSMIDKAAGLAQFKQESGFGDALKYLDDNPLPTVLVVHPHFEASQPNAINRLLSALQQDPLVDLAQLDMLWVKRLASLLALALRAIWIIGSLLALAVLLIIGNTIRLDIENRRAEIEVSKLIGASNAFIRRPFLYTGIWYGLLGGILAWLLTAISLSLMAGPIQQLTGLYESSFRLTGLAAGDVLTLIGFSCALGLTGSWLAVGRHLSAIEPS